MIPIKSWIGDQEDRELQKLIPYMEKLVHAVSVFQQFPELKIPS